MTCGMIRKPVAFGTIADRRRCGLIADIHLFADEWISFPGRHVGYQIPL